jgi:hypothetical protein
MSVPVALDLRVRNYEIEGPTRVQARKMAGRRIDLLAKAQAALAAGDDDRAFEYDCAAMDIETDLINFGFAKLI